MEHRVHGPGMDAMLHVAGGAAGDMEHRVHAGAVDAMLHVAGGTAVPRPALAVTILSGAIGQVRRSGSLKVKVGDTGSNADGVVLTATVNGVTIAKRRGI